MCEIILKLDFRRSCHKSQLLTDHGRQTKIDHKRSPCHSVTSELKSLDTDSAIHSNCSQKLAGTIRSHYHGTCIETQLYKLNV